MRRTVRFAFAALTLAAASPALANTPSPMNHTIPTHVVLVGHGPAGPDSATGHVYCIIRDLAANPIPNAHVRFDFSGCPDLTIATDQRDPRVTVNCAVRGVTAVSDENGRVDFTILGACTGGSPSPPQCLRIYADGVLLGSPPVAVLERDGFPGLALTDLSLWAADWFSGMELERADLDGSGSISVADLSVWAKAWFGGDNAYAIGAVCP
jgi:hypothetical protein